MVTVLVLGFNGFIGSNLATILVKAGVSVHPSNVRFEGNSTEESRKLRKEIVECCASSVVCCIGRTHPVGILDGNIDYLENNPRINTRDNMYVPMLAATVCIQMCVHYTYIGSGCIYAYTDIDKPELGPVHNEHSVPNFSGSGYSMMKGYTDQLMSILPVLNIRIRMPLTDFPHPRNLIDKLISYPKIHSVPNSMTVLDAILPFVADMIIKMRTGTYNAVCKGVISHKEILDMYKEIVDPSHRCEYITSHELSRLVVAGRSNCCLATTKLETEYAVPHIRDAVKKLLLARKEICR